MVTAFFVPTSRRNNALSLRPSTANGAALYMATDRPRTLYDKIWDDHLVDDDGMSSLIYVDRHLVHEVTSPQAFEGLRLASRGIRRPDCTLVTVDHNVPTSDRKSLVDVQSFIEEAASRTQVLQLETNIRDFGLKYFSFADERQGIVHIIGPEQGFTLPGCVTVCGDSHTATHGAFGALAFGIGTSEVEHVLATQVRFARIIIIIGGETGDWIDTTKRLRAVHAALTQLALFWLALCELFLPDAPSNQNQEHAHSGRRRTRRRRHFQGYHSLRDRSDWNRGWHRIYH